MTDIDLFDLFNIEHQDTVLDIFYDIKTYCYNNNLKVNIDRKYGNFFKLIYNNVDVEESSEFLEKYKNIENEEKLINDDSDTSIHDIDDYNY